MTEAFGNLSSEKRERIINAALVEFTKHGYKKASTDSIVREAGIGKGMLFYYFNSKRELYDFLVEYAIAALEDYFSRLSSSRDGDIIEHLRLGAKLKLEAYAKHPMVLDFVSAALLSEDEAALPHGAAEKIKNFGEMRVKVMTAVYERVDTSLFRDDFPSEKIIRFIQWNIEGYMQFLMGAIKGVSLWELDLKPYFKEFDEYLDDLKKIYYK